jgi:NADH:ubiquinone oxidoreductase subunit 6 (subunit J)
VVSAKQGNFIKFEYEMLKVSAFNAQFSRVILVIVQVGAVKIYVASLEALRKKKIRNKQIRNETQFTTKIAQKTNLGKIFIPSYIHV